MFKNLSDKLAGVFDRLKGKGILNEDTVNASMREIRIALLEADVALPVAKTFIENVKQKAIGQEVIKSVSPANMVVKIVSDELVNLLGTQNTGLNRASVAPSVYMLVGLQGSGKTTSAGKLALRLKKNGQKVLLASLDIYRPAAQEQLTGLAKQIDVDCLPIIAGQKPEEITKRALAEAKAGAFDVLILDTAGRLHIDEQMMDEVKAVEKIANPIEKLLVVDSLSGQDAVNVADAFHKALSITGIILTRVDGDARGGAALSMRQMTGQPIKFLGVGEKTDALEVFDAKRIADRILGMGDVVGLVETAMEKVNNQEAMEMAEKVMSGKFNLEDMLIQLRQIQSLGDIKGIMMMIPGMNKFREKIENANIDNKVFKRQEAIILSMTPRERKNPDIIKASRKQRIANGSGVSVNDVNRLLKQYEQMALASKKFKKMGPLGAMRMMKQMSSAMRGGNSNNPFMNNGGGFPPF
ncbi:MAG: signal recognition particle protein [Alphaproteobacteria bacterium]